MNYNIVLFKINFERDFGEILNHLQDVAEKALPKKEFNEYLRKSCADMGECDAMDGILINGYYFDWKEFNSKKVEIVTAWLSYFNEKQLIKIAQAL